VWGEFAAANATLVSAVLLNVLHQHQHIANLAARDAERMCSVMH
jgi:hypothetical protein